MFDCFNGMIAHHPGACPSHHLSYLLTHFGFVAMDWAFLAGRFTLAKLTSIQTNFCISEQFRTRLAKVLVFLIAATI